MLGDAAADGTRRGSHSGRYAYGIRLKDTMGDVRRSAGSV